jgi:hypothetical protein
MGFDVSPAALLLSEITGINADRWEIVESEFISNLTLKKNPNAVPAKFLIFAERGTYGAGMSVAHDFGGRRKVRYMFPYRDGQTTDDLGRKPETFEINCMIFGPEYREGLRLLLRECEQPSPGVLVHPVRGHMYVALEDYELTHSHDARRAVTVRLRFTEQSFTLDSINTLAPGSGKKSSLKTALVAALNAVKLVNGVITDVQSNIIAARAIAGRIGSALGLYKTAYVVNLQKINKTFNSQSGSDLPTLLPVNDGGVANPDGTLASNSFPVVGTLNDPFTGFPPPPDQDLIQAVATQQAIDSTNVLRDQVGAIIADLESVTPFDLGETNPDVRQLTEPVGSLVFRQQILDLKTTAQLMADALNTGVASSQFRIADFTVPRLMSVREAGFAAGLAVDLSYQIELLNPSLLSVNYIPKGTILRIPVPVT